jgi:hypothetical protein
VIQASRSAAERLAQARRDFLLVGGDRLGQLRLDRGQQLAHALDALEDHPRELAALARPGRGEILQKLVHQRDTGFAQRRRAVVAQDARPAEHFTHAQGARVGNRGADLARDLGKLEQQALVDADAGCRVRRRRDRHPAFHLAPPDLRLDQLPERGLHGAELVGQPELHVQKAAVDALHLRRERRDGQVAGRHGVAGHAGYHGSRSMTPYNAGGNLENAAMITVTNAAPLPL